MDDKKNTHLLANIRYKDLGETFDLRVPEKLEKRNIAYYSILLDLENCKEALIRLKKSNDEIIKTSLFTTVISLYGKCFTDSSTKKYPKLEPSIFNDAKSDFGVWHTELMEMRHNFIAHRGETELEFAFAYLKINPKTWNWGISVGMKRKNDFEPKEIINYLSLVEYLIEKTIEKYEKIALKIFNHIFENLENYKDDLVLLNKVNPELADYVMKLKPNKNK